MSNAPDPDAGSAGSTVGRSGSFAGRSRIGRTSVGRSLSATGLFLRRQLWIWPIIAALILATVAYFIRGTVERSLKGSIAQNLHTVLEADVAAMRLWLQSQADSAWRASMDDDVRRHVDELVELAASDPQPATLIASEPARELRAALAPWLEGEGFVGYLVFNDRHVVLASDHDELVGTTYPPVVAEAIDRALAGTPTVTRPFKSIAVLTGETGQPRAGVPTMAAVAGVEDPADKIVAALALRIRPEESFTEILNVAQLGDTGETYAFDRNGVMLSMSRFDEELKAIGLLVDRPEENSVLNLELRDPGVDMTAGGRPAKRRREQPLTFAVREATAARTGVSADGYNDYRGVPVVGAWTWLPQFEMGVVTEQDVAEALAPLYILRAVFWGMFALLFLAAAAIFAFTVLMAKAQRRARAAALEAKRLGQYALDAKIGEGGMGVVYRAHHALLQRPTAVKLLDPNKAGGEALDRFEREVRLTSQLNHPNTIQVYDFGRTPEGLFYYAMEFLDGISLEQLVRKHGPQPEGRVVAILLQVCGSLAEAHSIGLVHRDVKPANIMLCRRGGIADFAKLLDFGLVKHAASDEDKALTATGSLTGTPLYLSPEQVTGGGHLDARCDLYSLGAVGYFLLTGTPVFDGQSVVDICMKHVRAAPEPPSQRLGQPVSADLEAIILACLAKNPDDRPASAVELADRLAACAAAGAWSSSDANRWWQQNDARAETFTMAAPTAREILAATMAQPPE